MLSKMKLFKGESGQAAVVFALIFTVLCGCIALVVDFGNVSIEKAQLQNAIDAAVLAGARDLPDASKATASVNKYIQLNGYSPEDIEITFSDHNFTLNVVGNKEVNYTFARVFGLTSTTVHPTSSAAKESIGGIFNFTIATLSQTTQLGLFGSSFNITGSVHSNHKLAFSASNINVSGSCEAVSDLSVYATNIAIIGNCEGKKVSIIGSNVTTGERINNPAALYETPDFSAAIAAQAAAAGQVYEGDKTFSGTNVVIEQSIYVNGKAEVSTRNLTGTGSLLATGDINLYGSELTQQPGETICYYSKNGNINIYGSNILVDGIIFAPNGTISISGSNVTINGRLIADKLQLTGSNLIVNSSAEDLICLPSSSVKLTK